jgi:3-methyladenine DNA glycosylase AlkD
LPKSDAGLTNRQPKMDKIISQIRAELEQNADEKLRESGKRFFKEAVKTYGSKTALVSKMAKKYFGQIKDSGKAAVFELCETLWQLGYMEESFIACEWAYGMRGQYQKNDFLVFQKWIKNYVTNWASCDTLCNHSVGAFLEMYPQSVGNLKIWAKSKNRWERRAAAVSLIVPARKGLFLNEIFEICDILLLDKDDLVQKGYGWLLKVASPAHQKEVFDFVMVRKAKMPRTALRYAIEKMPPELKRQVMAK